MSENAKLLTIEETALRMRVSTRTVYAWRRAGRLIATRVGSRVYFEEASLKAACTAWAEVSSATPTMIGIANTLSTPIHKQPRK